mgnify:CR=1 FL=1
MKRKQYQNKIRRGAERNQKQRVKKYDPKKRCIVTQMRENQYTKQAVEPQTAQLPVLCMFVILIFAKAPCAPFRKYLWQLIRTARAEEPLSRCGRTDRLHLHVPSVRGSALPVLLPQRSQARR